MLRAEQATETNVRAVERMLILQLATHGFFGEAHHERDNPMLRSGLTLADIEQIEVDRELDDGQLTAYEVSGMDLLVRSWWCCRPARLGTAVMSEGKEIMSEGVSGLRRAFATAGARTTLMSLWEVSGVTTQRTMAAYYRKLAEGQGAAEAVQLEMLRTKAYAHPKDWAVFVISGGDEALHYPAGHEPRAVEDELPETAGRGGCATRRSGRVVSMGSMVIGLLGLKAVRRRVDDVVLEWAWTPGADLRSPRVDSFGFGVGRCAEEEGAGRGEAAGCGGVEGKLSAPLRGRKVW